MRNIAFVVSALLATMIHASPTLPPVDALYDRAERALLARAAEMETQGMPRWPTYRDVTADHWNARATPGWDSGYFAGALWQASWRTGSPAARSAAQRFAQALVGLPPDADIPDPFTATLQPADHDVGITYLAAFGHRDDAGARRVLRRAADQLAGRFDAARGVIRSWDWGPWTYPVIVDGMASIQALYDSAAHGGPAAHRAIATTHALAVATHQQRADGSFFHVMDFGPATPVGSNFQGYDDQSAWSRGQAWGIYGFAESYRHDPDPRLLAAARKAADYFLDHTPDHAVPFWDLSLPDDLPAGHYRRDASAAAIAADGLIALSELTADPSEQRRYFQGAERILLTLAGDSYLAPDTPGQTSLILHAVGNFNGGVALDASLNYSDYYFLEALMRHELAFPGPGIVRGDADRDGTVDFDDLLLLARHYGSSNNTWLTGDFDGDGVVDFDDLLALAQNYSANSVFGAAADQGAFADWPLARSLVPEPGMLLPLVCVAVAPLFRRHGADREGTRTG